MKGFFYEIGLPTEFTENYTKLNKNEPITLFEWQEKVLSEGKPTIFPYFWAPTRYL